MAHHHDQKEKAGKGPFLSDDQKSKINWELWCVARRRDGKDVKVYNFDGFAFRNYVDVGAIGGVNGMRDPYLHEDEIGIERMIEQDDEKAFLHHEIEESNRMLDSGEKYDPAHHAANNGESNYRQAEFHCPSPHITD